MAKELIYKELTFKLRRCIMDVYNHLGPGLKEETYKRALIKEFRDNKIPFVREKIVQVKYKDEIIDEYRIDLIAFDKIILELKAVIEIHPAYEAQLLSYLKVSGLALGLLVNFGSDKLYIKRMVNSHLGEIKDAD
ncbi:MAG: GxxExxY protein [Planctomycetes bacterium]|nr:GxxExxY protein [Planctomycetota bacterium]